MEKKRIKVAVLIILVMFVVVLCFENLSAEDGEVVGEGTVLINSNEVNESYRSNMIVIVEDLIPSIIPFAKEEGLERRIRFIDGDDSGKDYGIAWMRDNAILSDYGVEGDVIMFDGPSLSRSGDRFEVYIKTHSCGDGSCLYIETCSNCVADCGLCDGWVCDSAEECEDNFCVQGFCRSEEFFCGDYYCDSGEDSSNCIVDCGEPPCGDGVCNSDYEGCFTCPADCGVCSCGDGVCSDGESQINCWKDCGYPSCENGYCEGGGSLIHGHMDMEYLFANSFLPYRLLYPNNYNSSKSYPLVVSTGGSGEIGSDNVKSMHSSVFGPVYYNNYYDDIEFEAFSIVVQIPQTAFFDYPTFYYPEGSRGAPIAPYHQMPDKDGFFVEAVSSLVREMIENPYMNIDENRVYFTGWSLGGFTSFSMARESPDIWAAIWPIAARPIGNAGRVYFMRDNLYTCEEMSSIRGIVSACRYDLERGPDIKERLEQEVQDYKHIPFIITSGDLDSLVYGGELACEVLNEQGGNCTHYIYENCGHVCTFDGTDKSYRERDKVSWLFSQVKPTTPEINISDNINISITNDTETNATEINITNDSLDIVDEAYEGQSVDDETINESIGYIEPTSLEGGQDNVIEFVKRNSFVISVIFVPLGLIIIILSIIFLKEKKENSFANTFWAILVNFIYLVIFYKKWQINKLELFQTTLTMLKLQLLS